MKKYIITERRTDAKVLQALLLPRTIKEIKFLIGEGKYSAQALARSAIATDPRPTALVLDADTTDPSKVKEEREVVKDSVHQVSGNVPFEIFLAVPEIEAVFLQDNELVRQLVKRKLSSTELELANGNPSSFFRGNGISTEQIVKKLTQNTKRILREHPLIKSIQSFLDFTGPAYKNTLNQRPKETRRLGNNSWLYDVALSFTNQDKSYANALARELSKRKLRVFHAPFQQDRLWGEDLHSYLAELYQDKARYIVVFLSKDYSQSKWAKHELKAVHMRALRESEGFILPIRLDDSSLPPEISDIGYFKWNDEAAADIADALIQKLHSSNEY